jgi:NitT/TauT family transport system ATP-binding protein/nitrate/nitrite transport system substrate-binding protein
MTRALSPPSRGERSSALRIGFLRLTDAAPVIVAHEFGFFAEEGVETELFVEPSWANIADKLAYGFLDAAVIVPPLAFAITLGLRGHREPLIIPYQISRGGNTVTFATALAQEVRARAAADDVSMPQAFGALLKEGAGPIVLGVVHAFSTHNLLLRYWLASAGVIAGHDVKLSVVPPALAVEALQSGRISGFCAGAPWGEIATRSKLGTTVATSKDIWRNGPEKSLAVRQLWAEENPDLLHKALRAVLRASQFCDNPANASYTAALLSRRKYVDADSHAIMASLPGGSVTSRNQSIFFRGATTFPFRSQALWFLQQMERWQLLAPGLDHRELASRIYRPDLYRAAIAPLGLSVPRHDVKQEGGHARHWVLDADPHSIEMEPDSFCDGAVIDFEDGSADVHK